MTPSQFISSEHLALSLIDRSTHSLTPFPTRLPAFRGPCQSFKAILPTLRTRHPALSMVQGTWSMNMSYLVDWLVGCMNTGEEEGRPSLLLNPESLPQPWIRASGQSHFPGSNCYCTRRVESLSSPLHPPLTQGTPSALPQPALIPVKLKSLVQHLPLLPPLTPTTCDL